MKALRVARRLLPLLLVPLALMLALALGRNPSQQTSPLVGHAAPAFSGTTLDGAKIDLTSLHGRAVVVNFWASWCTACHQEHPSLLAASRAWGPQGVAFVGVLFQDQPASARQAIAAWGGGWPTLPDDPSAIAISYGVTGIPETFVLDRRGEVVARMVGPVDPAGLDAAISRAMQ